LFNIVFNRKKFKKKEGESTMKKCKECKNELKFLKKDGLNSLMICPECKIKFVFNEEDELIEKRNAPINKLRHYRK
jgi:acetyl-CoA carboxylase beta subunit